MGGDHAGGRWAGRLHSVPGWRRDLYAGDVAAGARLAKPYRKEIDHQEIVTALGQLFAFCARDRLADGRFGDFVIRIVSPARRETGHCDAAP
jgi:sulfite reductase beta subunit-like hemoprotein